MPVTSLHATNVKGMEFRETLSGRDIYIGENGIGKSARLQAFMFGVQGHLPTPFKKGLADTFQIASGEGMTVNIETDEMFSFSRQIRRKTTEHKDGTRSYSFKSSCSIFPDTGTKTNKERETKISAVMGDFAIMFDLDEFMVMSDAKKREFVFALSSPESYGWTFDRVFDELCSALGHNSQVEFDDKFSVADNVSSLLAETAAKLRDARAVFRDKQKVKAEVIEMRQRAVQEATGDISDVRAELKGLREKRSEYDKEIARADEIRRQHVSLRERSTELEETWKELSSVKLEGLKEIDHNIDGTEHSIELGEKTIEDQEKKISEIRARMENSQILLHRQREELARIDQRQAVRDQINIIDAKGCPLMGDQCKSDLSAYRGELEKKWVAIDGTVKSMREKRDAIAEEHKAAMSELGAEMEAQKLEKKVLKSTKAELKKLAGQQKSIQKDHDRHAAAKAAAGKEDEIVQKLRSDLGAIIDTGMAVKAVAGIFDQIDELEGKERKAQEVKNVMANFDQANIAAAEAEEEVEHLDKLHKALGAEGIQAAILKDVVGPLAETVNGLLAKIPSSDDEEYSIEFELYDMNGKDTFEINWPRENGGVRYNTLSGGQQILFGAALMVALILQADPPHKSMCIEAAELDAENFFNLLKALDAIAGDLDNILIATCSDKVIEERNSIEEWNVIHLE